MTRPLTIPEREALDRTMADINARLTLRQRVDARIQRPVFRLRRRHAVAMAIAAVLWLGAMQCAWWIGREGHRRGTPEGCSRAGRGRAAQRCLPAGARDGLSGEGLTERTCDHGSKGRAET